MDWLSSTCWGRWTINDIKRKSATNGTHCSAQRCAVPLSTTACSMWLLLTDRRHVVTIAANVGYVSCVAQW